MLRVGAGSMDKGVFPLMRRFLILFCCVCGVLTLAQAVPSARVWVVAIGVGKYTRNFSTLREAPEGARQVARALSDAQPDVTTVYLLTTDAMEDFSTPTKENVVETFAKLAKHVGPADRVIVYFAGHGVELNGKPYLLLMNITDTTNPETLETGSISVAWLRDKLNSIPCRERLLWLDACQVDALAANGVGNGTENAMPQTATMAQNAQLTATGGMAVTLYGCRIGERVYYSKDGPSFFTSALVTGLNGKAADPMSGKVTMASLARYVQEHVPTLVKNEVPGAAQHPYTYPEQVPQDAFVLRGAPPAIACPAFAGEYSKPFTNTVLTRLAASNEVNLVERTQLDQALDELKLQASGLTDAGTAQQLGKIVNAAYVLIGTVEKVPGDRLQVSVRLVNVDKAQQVPGVATDCTVDPNDPDTWKPSLQAMAEDLLTAMRKAHLTITRGMLPLPDVPVGIGDIVLPTRDKGVGSLHIESDPPGAQVFLGGDDTASGVTPLTLDNLPTGKMIVLLRRTGYGDVTQTVTIDAHKCTSQSMTLPVLQGGVLITSDPPGAVVTVDNQLRGVTTAGGLKVIGLSLGQHTVQVTLDNYLTRSTEVLVAFNAVKEVPATLQPMPGMLLIASVPPGAEVMLDDKPQPHTPSAVKAVAAGTHTVRVTLPGYATQQKTVTLAANDQQALSFTLEPLEKAQLDISSTPPGATIYINGKARGVTPNLVTLDEVGEEAQDVSVDVRLPNYPSASNTVHIKAGEQKTLTFALKQGPPLKPAQDLIQAIANAHDGDTITLAAKEYTLSEPLVISKSLTLVGAGQGKTIISSTAGGAVIRLDSSCDLVLQDMTISHSGMADRDTKLIYATAGTITVQRCTISGGKDKYGVGIGLSLMESSQGKVLNCCFDDNDMAIWAKNNTSVTIDGTICQNNRNGVWFGNSAKGMVSNSTCTGSKESGIMVCDNASVTIERTTCQGNANFGICFTDRSKGAIRNCTCTGNRWNINIGERAKVVQQNKTINEDTPVTQENTTNTDSKSKQDDRKTGRNTNVFD
ncbi:MAG TPA: PEGA domain-containing protein [Armatimonadota bacterium]|nr:PEGA domain-containing protein [Armatimonadota bacterium]